MLFVANVVLMFSAAVGAQPLPRLTEPVNDFAGVIDPASQTAIESLVRSLQQATGDVVVVATVGTVAPYADIGEFAVKLFENHGFGIGEQGKDNGLLVVVAVRERQVRVEVGYELEQFITDGFAGETSREVMAPEFRRGAYGVGLLAGVSRIVTRIAEGRNVSLEAIPALRRSAEPEVGSGTSLLVALFVLFVALNVVAGRLRGDGRRRYRRRWGGDSWSGWHSGVGPFGGGFGRGGGSAAGSAGLVGAAAGAAAVERAGDVGLACFIMTFVCAVASSRLEVAYAAAEAKGKI